MRSGADEIIGILKETGVEVVFGIPSIHNIALYEALRREPGIRHILCRQETAATHMADGFARAGRGPGVVITSTGPGCGYTVPALQEAWGSCSPVLLITTNIPSSKIGKGLGSLHELENQDHIFKNLTKGTFCVRSGEDLAPMTRRAVALALSGRPGPVYLEVPVDLLRAPLSATQGSQAGCEEGQGPIAGMEKALSLIHGARQPLLILGTGALRAGLSSELTALAERLGAPVLTSVGAKGIVSEDHVLCFGNAARRGVVRDVVRSCDLALAIGTRLREVDARRRGLTLPRLIFMDWDREWVDKNFSADVAVTGRLPEIVRTLLQEVRGGQGREGRLEWIRRMQERREEEVSGIRDEVEALRYLEVIRNAMPRQGILVADNTMLGYWGEYFYPSYCPGGFVAAKGSSTIGFAFSGAAGVKIAVPDRPVVALIGDGGFLYNTQELATCVRQGIGLPVIVVNDNTYGVISYLQRQAYGHSYESGLTNPDFLTLAKAYGAEACRVSSPDQLGEALERAMASQTVWLIELEASFPEPPFGRH